MHRRFADGDGLIRLLRRSKSPDVVPDGANLALGSAEVSIVIPCLNEADTLGLCIQKAKAGLRAAGIAGGVVVGDNGSTDESLEIARAHGARVVEVSAKGYGSALMGGIAAASDK